mgnify:CR=1 FL=1
MTNFTRRRFLEDSIMAAAAVALPARLLAADPKPASANEKLRAAIVGCGIRGKAHARELARLPDCEVAYVCDVDSRALARGVEKVAAQQPLKPEAIEHLLNAGREFLLAMTAVLGARADEAGGTEAAPTLTRIDIE